jgi:hypothetical protein
VPKTVENPGVGSISPERHDGIKVMETCVIAGAASLYGQSVTQTGQSRATLE